MSTMRRMPAPTSASTAMAIHVPAKVTGAKRLVVAITMKVPTSAATMPPVITHEMALGRKSGLAVSAAAKR